MVHLTRGRREPSDPEEDPECEEGVLSQRLTYMLLCVQRMNDA